MQAHVAPGGFKKLKKDLYYPSHLEIRAVRWLPLSHAIPLKWVVERKPFN